MFDYNTEYLTDCFRCGKQLSWPPHLMELCSKCLKSVDQTVLEALERERLAEAGLLD